MSEVNDVYLKVQTAGIPIVIALVEFTKRTFPRVPSRWIPTIAIFWGMFLYVVCAILASRPLGPAVLDGGVAGLVAVGLVAASSLVKKPA